jgi:glyoxylase-like metal-dependent hydrolase (beta-lactamase superfamily II)
MQVYKGILLMNGVGFESNMYLIDKQILVDTGTGLFFPQIKENFINLGIDPKKIELIVNTHCHFDHVGGNKSFRDLCDAEIAIHKNDAYALENGDNDLTLATIFGKKMKTVTVDRKLKEKDKIKTTNFCFEVIHTPGHTPGSICLYESRKKILISGDTLFSDGIGRSDLPGGDADTLRESLKKLSKLKITYLLPGHGMPKIGGIDFLLKQILARFK